LEYRKEIDGLRALAVLPVILFHGGISGFSGGYIGVDIFFVISGYLITSIILDEIKRNDFSIINFYERRARRILPALSVVLICTTIAAYILMPPALLKSYSNSLVSVTTFSSNIYFYVTSGYFETASNEKPLLHTWSLAVEEQYYLFFPIMIALLWSFGKRTLISILVSVTSISLLLAQFLSYRNAIDANFYLIFSRAWELFFGSLIAFLPLNKWNIKQSQREIISILGLMLIIYSILFFNNATPFPSIYTLLPVLGTCFIIIFSDSTSYVGRLLSKKVLVSIGLISYSLYLWHQPLFAFLRLKSVGEPSAIKFIFAIFLTFILSYLSWKYVERPFRNKLKFTRHNIFKYSALSIIVFLSIGLTGNITKGFEGRFDTQNYADSIKYSPKRDKCHTKGSNYLPASSACTYFGKNITWASFGDSHTVEPAYALAKSLELNDIGLLHLSFSGCPPSLLFKVDLPGCTKWINESLTYLENKKNITNVLLGFRYSAYLFGDQLDSYPNIPNKNPKNKDTGLVANSTAKMAREIYWKSFQKIVSRLLNAGKTIYILYPIPELPMDIHKAVSPFSILSNSPTINLEKTTPSNYYFNRNKFIINKLDSLVYGAKLHAIKPFDIICDENYCPAIKDNKALYFDDNHLSLNGAELLVKSIQIENPTPTK